MQTRFPNKILPYLLLSPSVIIVLVFFVVPSLQSLQLSFYRVSPLGTKRIFIGLENFLRLFDDPSYLNSAITSLQFAIFVVLVGLSLSLAVAVVANQRFRGFGIYRTLLIWPYALSPAIAGLIWAQMMDPNIGMASHILQSLFGVQFNYHTSSQHALLFVSVAAAWKMLGYNIIFFLSGLQSLPSELLEAASIDGAGSWRRFWRIAFPLLSPTTFFLFIMNTLYAFFEVFGLVHITTEGGPGRATDILVYKLYRDGFIGLNTGYASAQSIVLLVMVSILTILQFRYAGSRVFYQ
ncbi:MAG: sugar ABC transporter permease [Chloroflexi bacterium]|nr:MAG: sugar ABC transporter permease [Chloroflexota bacterium]